MATVGNFGTGLADEASSLVASLGKRAGWQELSRRYPKDRDCLAAGSAVNQCHFLPVN